VEQERRPVLVSSDDREHARAGSEAHVRERRARSAPLGGPPRDDGGELDGGDAHVVSLSSSSTAPSRRSKTTAAAPKPASATASRSNRSGSNVPGASEPRSAASAVGRERSSV